MEQNRSSYLVPICLSALFVNVDSGVVSTRDTQDDYMHSCQRESVYLSVRVHACVLHVRVQCVRVQCGSPFADKGQSAGVVERAAASRRRNW